jgi:hypothetical protein
MRLDVVGMAGFGGALAALLVFLMSLPSPDWVVLGIGVAIGAGLVCWELRNRRPFLDVRLLATNRALSRTYLRVALTMMCAYTVLYGVTQWLQAGRGLSAEDAGLLLLPMTAVSAVPARPDLGSQPRASATDRRGGVVPGGLRGRARLDHEHLDCVDRGDHSALRGDSRRVDQRQPDHPVLPGRSRRDRYCGGAVPNVRVSRLDRVLRADLDRVSHSRQTITACTRSR